MNSAQRKPSPYRLQPKNNPARQPGEFRRHRPKRWPIRTLSYMAIATTILLGGCKARTVMQCNALATVVNQANPQLAEFEATLALSQTQSGQIENLDDVKAIAKDYTGMVNQVVNHIDGLATDLTAVNLQDEQLIRLRDRYITLMTAYGTTLNEAGLAMTAVQEVESELALARQIRTSQEKLTTAVEALRSLTDEQNTVVQDFNQYCGATASLPNQAPTSPDAVRTDHAQRDAK